MKDIIIIAAALVAGYYAGRRSASVKTPTWKQVEPGALPGPAPISPDLIGWYPRAYTPQLRYINPNSRVEARMVI